MTKPGRRALTTRDITLTVCFTALYAVLGFVPLSPIIGLPSSTLTAAAVIAPLIGLMIGPYLGLLSAGFGGLIGLFLGAVASPSLVAGVVAAGFAGLLKQGRRVICACVYVLLLVVFAFYPTVGPVWLYPVVLWFQVLGFVLLISPVQSVANRIFRRPKSRSVSLFLAFVITCLASTLAGQIAGSLTFESLFWPMVISDVASWTVIWQVTAWVYPIERTIVAFAAASVAAALFRVLGPTGFRLGESTD